MGPVPSLDEQFQAYLVSDEPRHLAPVFEDLKPRVMAAARRAGLDEQGAEDVLQETFLALIEGATRFERGRRVLPWVQGIALRQIRAECRRRARLRLLFSSAEREAQAPSPLPVVSHSLVSYELRARIDRSIMGLSDGNQVVVRAALFEGLSIEEIGARHGLTRNAVSVRLHRGLGRLREQLGASLAEAPGRQEPPVSVA